MIIDKAEYQKVTGGTRLQSLDSLKAIAALGVVLIHFGFPGYFGLFIQTIARFGVPVFFMISGYFCYSNNSSVSITVIKRKLLRTLKLAAFGFTLYFLAQCLINGLADTLDKISLSNVIKVVAFNAPQITSAHLWFVLALIYCYLFFAVMKRTDIIPYIKIYILVALCLHVFIAELLPCFGTTFPHPIVRNAVLFGFPFFMIGYIIHSKINLLNQIAAQLLIMLCFAGTICSLLEKIILSRDDLLECYVGSIIFSISIFLLALKLPTYNNFYIKKLEEIGRNYSMGIYLIHPLVGELLFLNLKKYGIENYYIIKWVNPFIIMIMSILVVAISNIIVKCMRRFRNNYFREYKI